MTQSRAIDNDAVIPQKDTGTSSSDSLRQTKNDQSKALAPTLRDDRKDDAGDPKDGGPQQTQTHNSEAEPPEEQDVKPKDSRLKTAWKAIGLDAGTAIIMFKGSLPPTIAIAFYQAPSVHKIYGTTGYLVAIVSIISMCILPRAKFIQTMILNVIGICIGCSVALLGLWSSLQARKHTTPAHAHPSSYNSSQAAVCAIWLFAVIWFSNVMRAKIPALQFPVIIFSICTNVSFTFGPLFQTMAQAESLIKELLQDFLTAFAIATGVSLFIFPISSRMVVFKEMTGFLAAAQGTIKAQSAYLESLEKSDMFSEKTTTKEKNEDKHQKKESRNSKIPVGAGSSPEAIALKGVIGGLQALLGKLHGDIEFGKREIAYGKLEPDDLDEIFLILQKILIPLVGMSTITDIFERIAERRGWIDSTDKTLFESEEAWERDPDVQSKQNEKKLWNGIMKNFHEPFAIVSRHMVDGLEHASLALEFTKPKRAPKFDKKGKFSEDVDVEAKGETIQPGDDGFGADLEKQLAEFYSRRGQVLKTWAKDKNLTTEEFDAAISSSIDGSPMTADQIKHEKDQQQLYLILFMEYLLYSTGVAILELVRFADSRRANGTMKKSKFIFPGKRRIYMWITNLHQEDSTLDETTPDSLESSQNTVYMGASFGQKKDPEHLPAKNIWEKFGNGVRKIPHFLSSIEAAFGFRVACATMTVGIVAFLHDTQDFFMKQRLVWAMIIIAIGMTITAGQSTFGFLARVGGTALSMVCSMVIWYIVDQKTPGVIVMLWFFVFLEYYFFLKFPRFIPVFIMCIVTQVLIIGYELQVEVLGIKVSSASGQPYYPIYELAPYRLATVSAGCVVAFVWTIFPFPLSDRSWLRKDLGRTIHLLANYYSVVHSTIRTRIQNVEGDMENEESPGRHLEKARRKIFGKLMLIIPSLQQHAEWQRFEPAIGGKFPANTYTDIIQRIRNITTYLSLMAYATQTYTAPLHPDRSAGSNREWLDDLAILIRNIEPTSHSITSTLALLSASVTQGSALPPYMQLPEAYALTRRLEKLDKNILDAKHVEEPGYSAYAVTQVTSSLVEDDLRRLVEDVKELVGEVDFSFTVVTESGDISTLDASGKGKKD